MKKIKLYGEKGKGKHALIDDEDFKKINPHKWWVSISRRDCYRAYRMSDDRKTLRYMHHDIMGKPPKGLQVDHINGNPLDNRRCNLRFATQIQQQQNSNRPMGLSGVRGITWCKQTNKWKARITVNNKEIYLGRYAKKADAIKARKEAEIKYFDDFRYTKK